MDVGTTVISSAGAITPVLAADTGEAIVIPGGAWFLRAEFSRSGPDLKLTGPDGQEVVIRDYFSQENPPDLTTSDGVVLKGDIAVRLAGPQAPGQYAQAAPTTAEEPIGRVETAAGEAEVIRADGTRETLQQGTPVFQGDIIETGGDGSIGIVFADESTFSLGEEGRITLDEMVFDPGLQSGTMHVSLLQGAFTFVSGAIAKTDPNAMVISTPTATVGIRGTVGGGNVDTNGVTTAVLMPEGSGFTGEMTVGNNNGVVTINQPGQAVNIASIDAVPTPPFIMTPQQMGQTFGAALSALPNAAQAVSQDVVDGAKEGVEQQQANEAAAVEAEAAQVEAEAALAEAEATEVAAAAEAEAVAEAEAAATAKAEAAAAEAAAAEAEAAAAEAEAVAAAVEAEAAATAAAEAAAAAESAEEIAAAEVAAQEAAAAQEVATAAAAEAAAQEVVAAQAGAAAAETFAAAEAAAAETAQADADFALAASFTAGAESDLAVATSEVVQAFAAVLETSATGAVAVAAGAVGITVTGSEELDQAEQDVIEAETFAAEAANAAENSVAEAEAAEADVVVALAEAETAFAAAEEAISALDAAFAKENVLWDKMQSAKTDEEFDKLQLDYLKAYAATDLVIAAANEFFVGGSFFGGFGGPIGPIDPFDPFAGVVLLQEEEGLFLGGIDDDNFLTPEEAAQTQIAVGTVTAASLNGLTGVTIDAASVVFTSNPLGDNASAATFGNINFGSTGGTSFSLGAGFVISSGDATPPTTNTETAFSVIAGGAVGNVTVGGVSRSILDVTSLSFDFTVPNGTRAVTFDWMFGSEEYPEFGDSTFTDFAAVFVDGVNYLKFLDGSVVEYRNFGASGTASNDGTGPFFTDNSSSQLSIEYDGVTAPDLMVGLLDQTIADGGTHTIRFLVADTGDEVFDSALYIHPVDLVSTETAVAGTNDEVLVGTSAGSTISGDGGNDQIFGLAGTDILNGDAGNDRLDGGDGADTLTGGVGADILTGGTGADRFKYTATTEFGDRINDFSGVTGTQGDKIELAGITVTEAADDSASTGFVISTTLNLVGNTGGIFEINPSNFKLAGTSFDTAEAQGIALLDGTGGLVTNNAATKNLIILYDSAVTANAAVFYVDDANGDGVTATSEVSMVAFLEDVGLNNIADGDFAITA